MISENAYQSEVINLDFRRKSREARDTINAWVKQRTMDKIDSILNETPDPLTTVILLSALYFKGEWNQHFLGTMTKRYVILLFISTDDDEKINSIFIFLIIMIIFVAGNHSLSSRITQSR